MTTIGKPPANGPLRCDAPSPSGSPRTEDIAEQTDPPAANGLRVRFCGGCNPFIDRVAVVDAIRAGLGAGATADADTQPAAGETAAPVAAAGPADPAADVASPQVRSLYVSGCQRSCAAGHRLSIEEDPGAVVVAGEHVDAVPTAAAGIATAVIQKLTSPPGRPREADPEGQANRKSAAHKG